MLGINDWVRTVRPAIQRRMQAYDESEIRFNLLALVETDAAIAARESPRLHDVAERCTALLATSSSSRSRKRAAATATTAAAADAADAAAVIALRPEEASVLSKGAPLEVQRLLAATESSIALLHEQKRCEDKMWVEWQSESSNRCHNYVRTNSLPLSLAHTHTHTHTLSLSLSLARSLSHHLLSPPLLHACPCRMIDLLIVDFFVVKILKKKGSFYFRDDEDAEPKPPQRI